MDALAPADDDASKLEERDLELIHLEDDTNVKESVDTTIKEEEDKLPEKEKKKEENMLTLETSTDTNTLNTGSDSLTNFQVTIILFRVEKIYSEQRLI